MPLATVPCPSCDSPASAFLRAPDGREYGDCPACGLVFLCPAYRLDPEDERKRYLLHDNSPGNSGYVAYLESFLANAVLPFAAPGSRILDYGSGPRPLLSALLAARGYQASAWDPFFLDDRSAKAGPFDMVIAHEVIEHCARPSEAAGEIAGVLKPGGRACLSTLFRPESQAAFASWWYRQDSTHVSFFSAESLAALFRGPGLLPLWNDGKSRMVLEKNR